MKNPEKLLAFSGLFRYNEPRIDKKEEFWRKYNVY